ncbi:low specificity L-threonine aldolase [Microvirga sp. W0021]|uniref:L-threonine aldolase n=1 Tax=Hohaiivirga grylli TaxID=3133970 RepID=A0ABV0BLT8_9HYPH
MDFGSDNFWGASDQVLAALAAANERSASPYGSDVVTKRVEQKFSEIFEHDVRVFLVATGTAANALSLAGCVPPWGMTVCHSEAHINTDECGAPEFFTHGAKLATIPGVAGKMSASAIESFVSGLSDGVYQMPAKAVSISQLTEAGTLYSLEEIKAISAVCRKRDLPLHMDGARFANALVSLGCTAAEMTWKSGVDILSFGGSKNGCFAAEAIVVFKKDLAPDMDYLRKRAGQTLSKGRFLAAQFEGYFADDLWLKNAIHANAMASLMKQGLDSISGVRLPWAVQGNQLFPIISKKAFAVLGEAGATCFDWHSASLPEGEKVGADEVMVRLVTSFATKPEDVERFIGILKTSN